MVLLQLQSEDAAHVRINTLSINDIATAIIEVCFTVWLWVSLLQIVVEALKTAREYREVAAHNQTVTKVFRSC